MARSTDAQYRWLDTAPCPDEDVPDTTAEACFKRGWAEVEDVYRYQPATGSHRLVSSTFVLTPAGKAVLAAEKQRRLEQIGLEATREAVG